MDHDPNIYKIAKYQFKQMPQVQLFEFSTNKNDTGDN